MLKKITRRDEIWRSLNLRLFLVRLPKDMRKEELSTEQAREKISVMENVYANLMSVHDSWWNTFAYGKPVFALEITTPHIGEEISFYAAVPKRFAASLEKIIHANFPSASVEFAKDYNIFNPEGVTFASEVKLARNFIFPVKTYREISSDPMRSVTNVFSKLAREGEGASFQLVARPASGSLKLKIHSFAKEVGEGKARIRSGPENKVFRVFEIIRETIFPPSPQQEEVRKMKKLTPGEEELLKKVEAKAQKNLFEANVRLLASAKDEKRASEILHNLESALTQFNDPAANEFAVNPLNRSSL